MNRLLNSPHFGGEEIPAGGWRGGEEIPAGGWRAGLAGGGRSIG